MASVQDSEGLQVDHHAHITSKSPEVVPQHDHNSHYAPPGYKQPGEGSRQQSGVPLGMSIWGFGTLVAVITAIVVGGGVGGGLGAALANCQNSECSATVTPVATTSCPATEQNDTSTETNSTAFYKPIAAKDVGNVTLDCPDDWTTGQHFKSGKGYDFTWYCGVNAPAGSEAEEGGLIGDTAPIIAYTIEDCLNACAAMIDKDERDGTGAKCRSVVFAQDMSVEVNIWGANCWLKNATKKRGDDWGFNLPLFAYAERDD